MDAIDYRPYINMIVEGLIGLLVLFVLGMIAMLRSKLNAFIAARTTAAQRDTLHKLAMEAAALAESAWGAGGGQDKMLAAFRYVSKRAGDYGIDVSPETIKATIEKAVLEYNAQKAKAVPAAKEEHKP